MKTAGAAGTVRNAYFPGVAAAGRIQQVQQVGIMGHRLPPAAESPFRGQQQQQAQQQQRERAQNLTALAGA